MKKERLAKALARDRWNRWKSTQSFNRVGAEWEEKYDQWDKWLPSDDEVCMYIHIYMYYVFNHVYMYAWKDKPWFIRALSGSRIMISRTSGCLVNIK